MTLSKAKQSLYRARLFQHLDGLVTAPSAYELHACGLTQYLLEHQESSLSNLTAHYKANEGYLNVALRVLCSQGWLEQRIDTTTNDIQFTLNAKSSQAFAHFYLYQDVVELIRFSEGYHERKFEKAPFEKMYAIFQKLSQSYHLEDTPNTITQEIRDQIFTHIEGVLLGPTFVRLAINGMFHKYFMQASFKPEEFHKDAESFERLLDMLTYFKLFTKHKATYQFTDKGLFFTKRASAYGVTVSYLPTLRKLDQLLFGNPMAAMASGDENKEGHVDRAMNVWGSGGAHSSYFKMVDQIIISLFNKPITEQPKGILDMGCGNGAFLIHLFDVIEKQTLRGRLLDEHPLVLVGADYNEAALSITRANLIQADIWAKVIWGDIGNPEQLAVDLKNNYEINLEDLLNVRSFLDHNRPWNAPTQPERPTTSTTTGAYAYRGQRLSNSLVEASLYEHFLKWAPYVKKFGLLIIELHTVAPKLVAQHLGETAVTAYDATHGYSDQYIVEVDVFLKILAKVGLYPHQSLYRKFPNSALASVTVNIFSMQKTIDYT